jgi:hypothetical protein
MPFDWATFGLEILNFLVLVWLLARFLYRPIIGAIARRKAEIADTVAVAQAKEAEAHALARQYEERLASWEREKAQACRTFYAPLRFPSRAMSGSSPERHARCVSRRWSAPCARRRRLSNHRWRQQPGNRACGGLSRLSRVPASRRCWMSQSSQI